MAQKTYYLSAASTFLLKSGPGTVYGYTIGDPAAGGTVIVADLLNAGAAPHNNIPSTYGPSVMSVVKFPASPQPLSVPLYGRPFSNGLTVSITSTQGVTIHYD